MIDAKSPGHGDGQNRTRLSVRIVTRPALMKKPRRSGAKDALSRHKPRRKSTGLGQLNLTRFPADCELIIVPNREKPRPAAAGQGALSV